MESRLAAQSDPGVVALSLARNAVFGVLSEASRLRLARGGTAISLRKDGYVFRRGDQSDSVYAILKGEIEVDISGLDGKDVWLARLEAGTVIGEMGVLDGAPRSADARATCKTDLWRFSREDVRNVLASEPEAALALIGLMASRLRNTDKLVERTAPMNLSKRLARLLLEEAVKDRLIFNQSDLAHLVGATREAVNRKLASWRKANWVEQMPTGLYIRNRGALLDICRRDHEL